MKNLAPNLKRQRLLIEGFYTIDVNEDVIKEYFKTITDALELRMYGEPIVFATGEQGKPENQGYDAFVPLIDSGISVYIWVGSKFTSIVIYTCKSFDENKAINTTKKFFKIDETESMSF